MAAPDVVVNLADKFGMVDDHWSPRIVGAVNDLEVKIAKVQGEFAWHTHDETDEFFLVHSGELTIMLRDRTVRLGAGEFFVVPRGVEHRPSATHECEIVMLEPAGVVNTGDRGETDRTADAVWI